MSIHEFARNHFTKKTQNGDTAIGGTPVMDGDKGLESRLPALEKEIEHGY